MRAPYLRCSPAASAWPSLSGTAGMDSMGSGRRAFMAALARVPVSPPAKPPSGGRTLPHGCARLGSLAKETAMRNVLWTMGLGLVLAGSAAATSIMPPDAMPETRPWSEVEAIIDGVDGARPQAGAMKFKGEGQAYYFAADGRLAMLIDRD